MLDALATALTVRAIAVADTCVSVLGSAPPGGGTLGPASGGTGSGSSGGTTGGPPQTGPSNFIFILFVGFMAFMIIQMILTSKRQKKAQADLMSSLAKHDKVQTAGGMIGTIVEVKGDEVVLKVDESTNTKIRFTRNSVTAILKKGRGGDSPTEPETIDSVK